MTIKTLSSERQEIAQSYIGSEEEFSLLEELELVTVSIRGYASQIEAGPGVEKREEAIADLHQLRVFDRSAIAQFYDETRSGYLQMRSYIRMLDYLRLLVLEYLQMESRRNLGNKMNDKELATALKIPV